MCSSRWDTPILGRGSWALALRTQIPTATERTLGTRSDKTTTPLGAVVWEISRSSRTVSISVSAPAPPPASRAAPDRKSTRLNSSHGYISYAVFCLKKKKKKKKKKQILKTTKQHCACV